MRYCAGEKTVASSPVVFIGKGVEVLLFLVYDVLQAFVDRCAAVPDLLQHGLQDDHVTNHRVFQHVDLQDKQSANTRLTKTGAGQKI